MSNDAQSDTREAQEQLVLQILRDQGSLSRAEIISNIRDPPLTYLRDNNETMPMRCLK